MPKEARLKCATRFCFNLAERDDAYCRGCNLVRYAKYVAARQKDDDPLPGARPIPRDAFGAVLHQATCWLCGKEWWFNATESYFRLLVKAAPRCQVCRGPVGIERVPLHIRTDRSNHAQRYGEVSDY